jgi:hypothetical protein
MGSIVDAVAKLSGYNFYMKTAKYNEDLYLFDFCFAS